MRNWLMHCDLLVSGLRSRPTIVSQATDPLRLVLLVVNYRR